jgi:hypothetical protein
MTSNSDDRYTRHAHQRGDTNREEYNTNEKKDK